MRNYYIFKNNGTGWMQDDTIWLNRQDATDAMNKLSVDNPGSDFIIGYDNDRGMLTIPKLWDEIPVN